MRQSDTNEGDVSLAAQDKANRAFMKQHGIRCVGKAVDPDTSAIKKKMFDRPGLGEWFPGRVGDFDIAVALVTSRIFRRLDDFGWVVEEFASRSMYVASSETGRVYDPANETDQVMMAVAAGMNRADSTKIAKFVSRGLKGARAQGRWTGGVAPFGYTVVPLTRWDESGRLLVVDDWSAA